MKPSVCFHCLCTSALRLALSLLGAIAFASFPANAQTPTVLWELSSYGPGHFGTGLGCGVTAEVPNGCLSDRRTMAVDARGHVIVAGFAQADAFDNTGIGWKITKFHGATGAVLWQTIWNSTGNGPDQAYAMTLDPAGNVIATGYEWNGSDGDIKTIKFDGRSGAIVWETSIAGTPGGNDFGIYISTDKSGNAYVGGSTWNGVDDDMRTVKYAAGDGAVIWDRTFAGPGNGPDYVFALAVDPAGNVIVTGESRTLNNPLGDPDWKTIKYAAADGAIAWEKTAAGIPGGLDIPTDIAIDAAGNAVVIGYVSVDAAGNTDMKVIKYAAADGAIIWEAGFADASGGGDFAYAIALDLAGNAIVSGPAFSGTDYDWKTIKFAAANGALLWERSFAGSGNANDVPIAVTIDQSGNAIVGGRNHNGLNKDMKIIAYAASDGATLWEYDYAGTAADFDRVGAIAAAPGAVFVAGESTEAGAQAAWRIIKLENSAAPLAPTSVFSRKLHGAAGVFDLPIDHLAPINSPLTVEPRAIGAGHQITFHFNAPVTSIGTASVTNAGATAIGSAAPSFSGRDVTVTLTGIADDQRARVSLSGVNGSINAEATMGFLVGDVSSSLAVNAADISATKARVGQALSGTNFLFDFDASGDIGSNDVRAAKARSGKQIP